MAPARGRLARLGAHLTSRAAPERSAASSLGDGGGEQPPPLLLSDEAVQDFVRNGFHTITPDEIGLPASYHREIFDAGLGFHRALQLLTLPHTPWATPHLGARQLTRVGAGCAQAPARPRG